jgi:hypothetical protein
MQGAGQSGSHGGEDYGCEYPETTAARKKRSDTAVNASFSGHASLELVFVMKAAENRRGYNAMILWNATPFHLEFGFLDSRVWNSGSKTHVWTRCIVMTRPFFNDLSDMSFAHRNHEIPNTRGLHYRSAAHKTHSLGETGMAFAVSLSERSK